MPLGDHRVWGATDRSGNPPTGREIWGLRGIGRVLTEEDVVFRLAPLPHGGRISLEGESREP